MAVNCGVVFLFESFHPLAHAGYIEGNRSLPTGHDALFLRHIARDLLHALPHRQGNTWMAFGEPVVHWWRQVDNMIIEVHLSETNRFYFPIAF